MTDDDYRNRFRAEYYQLKIRLEHLNAMLDEYRKGTLGYEPDCPFDVLYRQKIHMTDYMNDLKVRAGIERISL